MDVPQMYGAFEASKSSPVLSVRSAISLASRELHLTILAPKCDDRLRVDWNFRSNQSPTFMLLMTDTRSWMYCFPIPPSRRKRSAIGLSSLETFVLFPDPG